MIRYALRCAEDHAFESWFQSAEAYEALKAGGHIVCPHCGDAQVDKAMMAPGVRTKPAAETRAGGAEATADGALRAPADAREAMLTELRRHVEANSDYVGANFAAEARAIHEGSAPTRPIYGEARVDEARSLVADGVPVAPLPFTPRAKTN